MNYLVQKNRAWYVRVQVPPRLREAVGRREYWVALKTRDITAAKRLAHTGRCRNPDPEQSLTDDRFREPARLLEIAERVSVDAQQLA